MKKILTREFNNLLPDIRILCIGDLILDHFIDNQIIKISDEDPVNVIEETESNYKLGGIGNVALNLKNAGMNIKLVSIGAKDDNFKILKKLILKKKINSKIFLINNKITSLKKRYYINKYHLIRQDSEDLINISNKFADKILNYIHKEINSVFYDVILISDYGKGLITKYFFTKLNLLAKNKKIKILTDPKSKNLEIYNGSYVLKTNKKEINDYLSKFDFNIDDIENNQTNVSNKIIRILNKLKINNIIVTRSEKSTIIFKNKKVSELEFIPVSNQDIINTTGAGDTFFSYFAINYIVNNNFKQAVEFAHLFSKFAINKFGTYAPTFSEIFLDILQYKELSFTNNKVIIKKIILDLKLKNFTIGFTNGCFDILHAGHINLLKKAKSKCDFLIVGLNNDASVKKLKGIRRPFNNIETRSLIMSSLNFVDLVCIFDEITPLKIIKLINPNFLFKGSDYKAVNIVGYDFVKKNKGKIIILKNYKKYSSTNIINKAIKSNVKIDN